MPKIRHVFLARVSIAKPRFESRSIVTSLKGPHAMTNCCLRGEQPQATSGKHLMPFPGQLIQESEQPLMFMQASLCPANWHEEDGLMSEACEVRPQVRQR